MNIRQLMMIGVTVMATRCGGKSAGSACEVTGDGFTRHDPCHETCIEWEIDCADGSAVVPAVCSGGECQTDADCDSGFACAQVGSFTKECLPEDTCDAGF
jgi:hypothetical protein